MIEIWMALLHACEEYADWTTLNELEVFVSMTTAVCGWFLLSVAILSAPIFTYRCDLTIGNKLRSGAAFGQSHIHASTHTHTHAHIMMMSCFSTDRTKPDTVSYARMRESAAIVNNDN